MWLTALRRIMAFESVGIADGSALRSDWKPVLIDLGLAIASGLGFGRGTHSRRFCSLIRCARRRFCPVPGEGYWFATGDWAHSPSEAGARGGA